MSIYLIPLRVVNEKNKASKERKSRTKIKIIMREIAMETQTERRKTNRRRKRKEIVFVHAMNFISLPSRPPSYCRATLSSCAMCFWLPV
jgi:hypothetical protein